MSATKENQSSDTTPCTAKSDEHSTGEPRNAHTAGRDGKEIPGLRILGQWHRRWKANLGYKESWMLVWATETLLSKRAGGNYGSGWRHCCQGQLIISRMKRELTPESCPVTSVALRTAGPHVQDVYTLKWINKILSYVIRQHNPRCLFKNSNNLSVYQTMDC